MASIMKKPFGTTKAGVPVELYTLDDGVVRVQVMTLGGTIVSIEAPDRHDVTADVCLGFASPQAYEEQTCYIGATVGRYANRIGNAKFALNGVEYSLYPNDGKNHLHGGPHGFHTKVWKAEEESDALVLSCESADMEEGYPGRLSVRVRYTLVNGTLTLSYHAKSDRDTVVNLTNHAYFNLAGQGSGSILKHRIRINADRFTRVGAGAIPTGGLPEVAGTPFDFRTFTEIGAHIDDDIEDLRVTGGYDHNFVLNGGGFREAACVYDSESGRMLTVKTDLPGVQFYAGNSLDGTLCGKDSARYVRRSGFCLETQFFPDTPNHPEFPACVLRAGEDFHSKTSYTFSAVNEM
ncbi:MAG: aldose epimerase family protein [Oscillospiraceae bacterium]|nr:galactose mutarotase [Oscillospiraceae bacterium]MDY3065240.1 aldose epimerase family protein [Oscillospiraceae bacterium]